MKNQDAVEPEEVIISVGILDGRALNKPAPVYPALVKSAHLSGRTVVDILIDKTGQVEKAEIVSGHPLVYNAVLEAAKQAKFYPTLVAGQPVKVSGILNYDLDDTQV